jgi:hypothetical protein
MLDSVAMRGATASFIMSRITCDLPTAADLMMMDIAT